MNEQPPKQMPSPEAMARILSMAQKSPLEKQIQGAEKALEFTHQEISKILDLCSKAMETHEQVPDLFEQRLRVLHSRQSDLMALYNKFIGELVPASIPG